MRWGEQPMTGSHGRTLLAMSKRKLLKTARPDMLTVWRAQNATNASRRGSCHPARLGRRLARIPHLYPVPTPPINRPTCNSHSTRLDAHTRETRRRKAFCSRVQACDCLSGPAQHCLRCLLLFSRRGALPITAAQCHIHLPHPQVEALPWRLVDKIHGLGTAF
jgi:hypothetical protein